MQERRLQRLSIESTRMKQRERGNMEEETNNAGKRKSNPAHIANRVGLHIPRVATVRHSVLITSLT